MLPGHLHFVRVEDVDVGSEGGRGIDSIQQRKVGVKVGPLAAVVAQDIAHGEGHLGNVQGPCGGADVFRAPQDGVGMTHQEGPTRKAGTGFSDLRLVGPEMGQGRCR